MSKLCPCGSELDFDQCCKPIIEGIQPALTAESLMRSRYVAFTLGDADYLMKSWASEKRNLSEKEEIRNWARAMMWVKLKILNVSAGKENDMQGYVTFQAFYREKGKLKQICEESYFEKRNDGWVYVSGIHK